MTQTKQMNQDARKGWQTLFDTYQKAKPQEKKNIEKRFLPQGWQFKCRKPEHAMRGLFKAALGKYEKNDI